MRAFNVLLAESHLHEAVTYVAVKDLPPSLQGALREFSYGSKDISVEASSTGSVFNPGAAGSYGFAAMVDLVTGATKTFKGGYDGGSKSPVDRDEGSFPMPPNGALIVGSMNNGKAFASISVHPSNMATLLPSADDVTPNEKKALMTVKGMNSSGRISEFEYLGLGTYGPQNPLIKSLVAKGMLKATASGAISITTAGKNAAGDNW